MLKSMSISGELHKLFENYLSGRLQMVVLNAQSSSSGLILAGVLQRSTLGPLLFFICINDLPNGMKSNAKVFGYVTSLFTIVKDKNSDQILVNQPKK